MSDNKPSSRSTSSGNSSSRSLYPGFGTGKKPYRKCYQAYTFKSINRNDLNPGDKIILPEKTLKDIKRLRLPFPFCFEIRRGNSVAHWKNNTKDIVADNKYRQFCSALEFSGKDTSKIYIPIWMFKNLKIKNGAQVTISSALNLPKGESVTIQPEKTEFIDLIHELGPQTFLEQAMKSYSVLSLNERLLIEINEKRFYIKLVDTKPRKVISILGDVDLNIEFSPPDDSPEAAEIKPTNENKDEDKSSKSIPKKKSKKMKQKKSNNNNTSQENNKKQIVEQIINNEQENNNNNKGESHTDVGETPEDIDKINEDDWNGEGVGGWNGVANKISEISIDEDNKSDGIVIDQEDPETRKRRVREAAMKRYEKLMGAE